MLETDQKTFWVFKNLATNKSSSLTILSKKIHLIIINVIIIYSQ